MMETCDWCSITDRLPKSWGTTKCTGNYSFNLELNTKVVTFEDTLEGRSLNVIYSSWRKYVKQENVSSDWFGKFRHSLHERKLKNNEVFYRVFPKEKKIQQQCLFFIRISYRNLLNDIRIVIFDSSQYDSETCNYFL